MDSLFENELRKTQAATIIANALHYHPSENETPYEIVSSAIAHSGPMSEEQVEIVKEMLDLAESIGISDDEWSEEDLDKLANSVDSWDDIASAYEPGELHLVDDETGEVIDDLHDELRESELNEVLSRVERIKARMRFHKTEVKRERKMKVALTHHSSAATINKRARHMAIKAMKMRIAKKPLEQLSVTEKERLEKIVAKRGKIIDRLALKMTQRVRMIEKNRLTHKSTK